MTEQSTQPESAHEVAAPPATVEREQPYEDEEFEALLAIARAQFPDLDAWYVEGCVDAFLRGQLEGLAEEH